MAVFLPDPFDDWSAILEEPVMRAIRIWLDDHVRPSVFRTLVAAADDEEVMPNIEAILAAAAAWDLVLAQEMTPTQIGLIAARVAAMTDARGVDVAALPRAAGLRDELADALDEAMVAMTRAGVATGQMTVIIDTATWVDFIDDYARAAVNRVSGMPESVYREMVQVLAKAVKDGMNPQDRAALVREFLDLDDPAQYERWRRRAQTIARTETNSLINAADLQAGRMEQQLTGEEMHKAWLCVAPDTIVGAIDVRHAARREYVGTLVRITTASGRELSLTPEHPVLTGRGWVAAGDLDLSDNLFQVVHAQTPGAPDVQDSPPVIGQVVDAAMNASDAKVRTVRSGVDLNVDAKAHDVEVVVADRDLSVNLEAVVAERSRDLHLTSADALAHALVLRASGPLVGAGRHRSTAGLFSDSAVLLGLHRGVFPAGADDSSGGLAADGNPGFPENTADHVVAGAVAIADSVEGVSGGVLSDDGRSVYVGSSPGRDSELLGCAGLLGGGGVAIEPKARSLTRRSGADAAFGESAADGAVVRSDGGGDLLEGVSGLVEADDLVDIERYSFVGHVYDLETAGHWYQANGLVVHNCTLDRRTRDSHFKADGQRVPLDGKFTIGGYECDHPGDQHLPAHESINCVTGDTHVAWPRQGVLKSTRRPYSGTLVELITADGNHLTITPNHPVLTPTGYCPAGLLRPGDEVISTLSPGTPQVSDMPPRAEELHRALSQSGVAQRVVAGRMDFHCDVPEEHEVEVVGPNGDLCVDAVDAGSRSSFDDDPLVLLEGGHGQLPGDGTAVVALGDGHARSVDGRRSSARSVGGGDEITLLTRGHGLHAQSVGFGSGSDGQIEFVKPPGDEGSADAELARHLKHAHAVGMESTQLIEVNFLTGRHDVYNLSTTDEWYIANGIAVHNCRCTTLLLDADEPLPDETDRQTERERADGTRRDPQAEVRRRAADGVTRARDDAPQTVTAAMKEKPMRTTWSGVLAPIDKPTGDGRIIDTDAAIEFREFPLPLMFQRATSSGHDAAVVVGKIAAAVVEGGAIHATGELFDTDDAGEARELLSEGVIRPSVDMCDMVTEWEVVDGDGKKVDPEVDEWDPSWSETMHVRSATIMAATLVSKPAFAEAKIVLGDEVEAPEDEEEETAALVASAVALAPVDQAVDSAAFADPGLDGPTALTVTDDGRVFGHLALWGTEHVGIGRGVTPPHSKTDYALFHVSTVTTDEGPVSVGRLTVGTGHAGPRDGAHAATAHYDETGTCWALVRAGEDAHGIWVAGIINPDADTATVRAGASAPLSGDWRAVGGNLELVAALSVNTPGFPVPRSYAVAEGAEMSLVAAAVVPRRSRADELADAVAEGLRRHEERRAAAEATEARTVEARRMAAALLAGGIK